MSIAGALPGIGAAVTGFMNGQRIAREETRQDTMDQRRMANEDASRAFEAEQRGRVRKGWSEADATDAALKAADEAGRKAYTDALGGSSAVDNAMTNGGSDGSMPDQSGVDSFKVKKPDTPEHAILAGMAARTKALADAGQSAPGISREWLKSHSDTAALREQLRTKAVDMATAKFKATGDPSGFIDAYNRIDDGHTAKSITKTPDGKYRLERVNDATGKVETKDMTPEEFQQGIQFLSDPAAARKHEMAIALEDTKTQNMLKRIREQGLNTANVATINGATRRDVAETGADARVEAAKINAGARITVGQLRGLGSGGKGGSAGVQSVQKNGDGTSTIVMRDGTTKILTDDNGAPIVGDHAVRAAMTAGKIIAASPQGLMNTPAQNAAASTDMVKGLNTGMAPKQGLNSAPDAMTTTGKPVRNFLYWGDKK